MKKGLFISFEGIDGCGKSTMLQRTAEALKSRGFSVCITREPGGSELGRSLRALLLDTPKGTMDKRTEALLFAADRAAHVAQIIRPALERGEVVLCDRYVDSSYAYQGGGRHLSTDELRMINGFAMHGVVPDLTLLLNLSPEAASCRLHGERDRMEQEKIEFFRETANAFLDLAAAEPERFCVVDASQPLEDVADTVVSAVFALVEGVEA